MENIKKYINQFLIVGSNGLPKGIADLGGLVNFLINGIKEPDGKRISPPLFLRKVSGKLQLISKDENGGRSRAFVSNFHIDQKLNELFNWATDRTISNIRKKIILTLEDNSEQDWIDKGFIKDNIVVFKNNVTIEFLKTGEVKIIPEKEANKLLPLNIIETNFNPKVDMTFFESTMKQICSDIEGNFYESKYNLLQEFLGYCLVPTAKLQCALIIKGSGSNGKGIIDESFSKTLGKKNVSGEKVNTLVQKQFSRANIIDKLVNIDSDGSNLAIQDSAVLKEIVAGDEIAIDVKFEQGSGQKYSVYSRLLIFCNHIPKIIDSSDAWERRIKGLILKNKFGVDPLFKEKTLTVEFREAFIQWCIKGYQRLIKNNYVFTKDEEFLEELETIKENLHPEYKFAKENNFFKDVPNLDYDLIIKDHHYESLKPSWIKITWPSFCQKENIKDNRKSSVLKTTIENFVKNEKTKQEKKIKEIKDNPNSMYNLAKEIGLEILEE